MKKIMTSVCCLLVLLTSLLAISVSAQETFSVNYDEMGHSFVVSGNVEGTNRIMLMVNNPEGELVYADAKNDVSGTISFDAEIESLIAGDYTFIISSAGAVNNIWTVTYTNEVVSDADWFTVDYNEAANSFNVSGTATGINRIMLMVYDPYINGESELVYMDAVNANDGNFTFNAPMNSSLYSGEYTFVVSVKGEEDKYGIVHYTYKDRLSTCMGEDFFKAEYTLTENETAPTVMLALYRKNDDGSETFEKLMSSNTEVEGKVLAEINLEDGQNIEDYCAKCFVWDSMSGMIPQREAIYIK